MITSKSSSVSVGLVDSYALNLYIFLFNERLIMKKNLFELIFVIILSIIISNQLLAQTFLFQDIPKENTQLGLRFMQPSFEGDSELSTLSGIYDLTFNIPINANWNIAGSLPYITSTFGENDPENGMGNIYIGMQSILKNDGQKKSIASFGLFLPTADEDIQLFGLFTHLIEFHKYTADVLTIYGNFAFFNTFPHGVRLGLEIGPNLMLSTKDDRDTEFLLHYGLTAGYQSTNFALITEMVGILIITEDENEFSDRFQYSLNFGGSYVSERISPGIFYKIYLKDDFSDIVDGVLGINIEVTIN